MAGDKSTLEFTIKMKSNVDAALKSMSTQLEEAGVAAETTAAEMAELSVAIDKVSASSSKVKTPKVTASSGASLVAQKVEQDALKAQNALGKLSASERALVNQARRMSLTLGKSPVEGLKARLGDAGLTDIAQPYLAQIDKAQAEIDAKKNELSQATVTGMSSAFAADVGAAEGAMNELSAYQQKVLADMGSKFEAYSQTPLERMKQSIMKAGLEGTASGSALISKIEAEIAKSTEGHGHGNVNHGAMREIMVLFHETVSGRWKNAMSSFTILLDRLNILPLILSPVGISLLAVGAALGVVGVAALKGQEQLAAFDKGIMMTNGYMGLTVNSMQEMAQAIGGSDSSVVMKAQRALADLQATGQFTAQGIQGLTQSVITISDKSGESIAKVSEYITKGMGDTNKWAIDQTSMYHDLTEADIEYINQLVQNGDKQEAVAYAAQKWSDSMKDHVTENVGYMVQAFRTLTGAITDTWAAMEQWGQQPTEQMQIAALQAQKSALESQPGSDVNPALSARFPQLARSEFQDSNQAKIDAINKQIADLQADMDQKQKNATAQAKQVQIQQAATDGRQTLLADPLDKGIGEDTLKAAIQKAISDHEAAIAAVLKGNPNSSEAKAAEANLSVWKAKKIKELTGEYTPPQTLGQKNALKLESTYQAQTGSISDALAKTNQQIADMQKYGKTIDDTQLAVIKLQIAQGKLKGLDPAEIKSLEDLATQADAASQKLKAVQEAQQEHDSFQEKFLSSGPDDMDSLEAKTKQLELQYKYQADSTAEIERQVDLAQIQENLSKGIITASEARQDASVVNKYTATEADGNTATAGTESAFSKYVYDSTNAAVQVKNVWTDTFSGMEDTLVRVLEGGKADFREFTLSVVNDLLKMEVEKNIMGPLVRDLGSLGGGKNGSAFGSILGGLKNGASSAIGSLFGSSKGGAGMFSEIGKWASSFFADGGIMTSKGSIPLNKYANGGVANSPQMAIFGEGRGPEAYVPLPDGRSIPVTMSGASGGGNTLHSNVTNHITVNSDGSTQITAQGSRHMAQAITHTVQQELIKQTQNGGLFSPSGGVFGRGAFQ